MEGLKDDFSTVVNENDLVTLEKYCSQLEKIYQVDKKGGGRGGGPGGDECRVFDEKPQKIKTSFTFRERGRVLYEIFHFACSISYWYNTRLLTK